MGITHKKKIKTTAAEAVANNEIYNLLKTKYSVKKTNYFISKHQIQQKL